MDTLISSRETVQGNAQCNASDDNFCPTLSDTCSNALSSNTLSSNTVLAELLNQNDQFALNARGTTNHCPMALIALAAMGASPERLQDFFNFWRERYALPAAVAVQQIAYHDFPLYLGKKERFTDLRLCFAESIAQRGIVNIVSEVLASIPFAPATSAFHALIRLAYGLQVKHISEIAAGLAALVVANFRIDLNPVNRQPASSVNAGFRHLAVAMDGKAYPGQMITEKMQAVVRDAQFQHCFSSKPESEELLDELALWAIAAYWQTRDFTILHTVTGIHAARQIMPYLDRRQAQDRLEDIWLALAVAYVSVGAPPLHDADFCLARIATDYDYLASWSELYAAALVSNDDHVIKFTYTCSLEARLRPHALYQAAVMDLLQAHA